MDPATILALTNLLAQLIPAGISLYSQLEQNNSGVNVVPLATVLQGADANWDAIYAAAQAQLAKTLPPAQPPTA